jgi:hypothetical protein
MVSEEGIERGDLLREIMDMLATDEARHEWSLRVDQLIDGEMSWQEFSNLAADGLDLQPNRRAYTMGPGKSIHNIITSA